MSIAAALTLGITDASFPLLQEEDWQYCTVVALNVCADASVCIQVYTLCVEARGQPPGPTPHGVSLAWNFLGRQGWLGKQPWACAYVCPPGAGVTDVRSRRGF